MFSNTKVLERERSKKMEDYKNITPPSSPTFSFSGNNENLNESKRNSEQISKKPFMSPTISTASKSVTPNKKRILAERKPPKMGTISSSTTPTKSLSKISTFFSEDETFVPDSTTKPYDPVTNYLSPRPKFLRYNPNRKRKLVLQTQAKSGSTTTSSSGVTVSPKSVSLDSQSSCSAFETTGNPDQEIVEDEDEEEVGWKWVLLNWFFVIFAVVFCTKYISSMNNNPEMIEFQDFGNLTFGIVSLRSLDSGYWVSEFDAKYLYEFVSEIEENQVPFSPEEGNLNYEIDYAEHFRDLDGFKQDIGEYDAFPETIVEIEAPIDGFKQDIGEYDAFPETIVEIEAPIDGFKQDIGEYDAFPETIVEIEAPIDGFKQDIGEYDAFPETIVEIEAPIDGFKQDIGEYDAFPETIVEIEAPIDGFKQDIGEYDAFPETIVEIEAPIDGFKQDIGEYDAFPETIVEIEAPIDGFKQDIGEYDAFPETIVEIEAPIDGFKQDIGEYDAFPETIVEIEAPIDGFKQDIGEYDAFPETIVEIEAPIDGFKQDIGEYDAFPETIVEIEAPIVAEPKFEGDEVKNLVFDATIAAPKPNVVGEEEKLVDFKEKIHDLAAKEVEIAGDDHEVVGDNHENKEVDIVEIGEKQWRLTKMEYIWVGGLTVASYVGFLVVLFIRKWKKAFTMSGYSKRKRNSEAVKEESGRSFREDLELHNCLAVNVESMQKTPTAKLVGEVDFGGQFSGAVKMQGRDGSVFSVPDERSTKKSKVSSSSSTSTSTSEDGKEEGTALRRSQRLRKKGVASP
ncbi:hypothetical protein SOVF_182990 [Spinacia oleracea]|nr:hypothetical protein SOVF_182990 [Spinacia oleracea]